MTPRWIEILQRIIANIVVDADGCWIYQGPTNDKGYGRIYIDGVKCAVHRVVFIQFSGYLPPKKHVDHACQKRLCCNPVCLEGVTHRQNQRRKRRDPVFPKDRTEKLVVSQQVALFLPQLAESGLPFGGADSIMSSVAGGDRPGETERAMITEIIPARNAKEAATLAEQVSKQRGVYAYPDYNDITNKDAVFVTDAKDVADFMAR